MVKFEGKNLGEKVEDKIWGKILVQKYWLQKMNKSFVHQSKAQVLWLKFCAHKFWVGTSFGLVYKDIWQTSF